MPDQQQADLLAHVHGMIRLSTYQAAAARTMNPKLDERERLANYALGLAGEAGEVADTLKKHLFHARPLDPAALRAELGDVLWYCAAICTTLGWQLGDVAAANVEKLRARHPLGFDPGYHQPAGAVPDTAPRITPAGLPAIAGHEVPPRPLTIDGDHEGDEIAAQATEAYERRLREFLAARAAAGAPAAAPPVPAAGDGQPEVRS